MSSALPSISYWRRRRGPLGSRRERARRVLIHAPTKQVFVVYEETRCDRIQIERVIYDEGYDVIPTRRASGRSTVREG